MRCFLTLLAILILSLNANSQSPGYLGKKFILSAGYSKKVSFFKLVIDQELQSYSFPELSFSYVISQKNTIGLSFINFKSTIPEHTYYLSDNSKFSTKRFNINTIGIGLNIKSYSRGFIAPIGGYISNTIAIYHSQVDKLSKFMGTSKNEFINRFGQDYFDEINQKCIAYYLGISMGRNFILYEILGLDLSFNMGIAFNKYFFKSVFEEEYNPFNQPEAKQLNEAIAEDYQINVLKEINNVLTWGIKVKFDLII